MGGKDGWRRLGGEPKRFLSSGRDTERIYGQTNLSENEAADEARRREEAFAQWRGKRSYGERVDGPGVKAKLRGLQTRIPRHRRNSEKRGKTS